jgi:hypothetical protein
VLAGEVAARRADRRWRLRGSAVPTPKPRRDDTLIKALVRASLAAQDRERSGEVDH